MKQAESDGPLSGLRVLEMGQLIAGPYCGQVMADFGADVVKVEAPGSGDPMRKWGTIRNGKSLSWSVIARNKRCIEADLKSPEGHALAVALIAQADVVIENFRPGTLERLHLGYEEMATRNAGVIYVRLSGYGQYGPYAHRAGYGSIGEAMGGLRYLTGDPDRPPARIGVSIGDELAGLHGALGVLLALRAREQTGRGQVIDVSIYESVLAMTEALISEYALTGVTRERTGSVLPNVAPSNLYPTADGEQLLIAANQDTVFGRLATAMGASELATSPEFATHIARGERQVELDELISRWTKTWEADALLAHFEAHGVPAGRLYKAVDMLTDPHFQARSSIVTVDDPTLGSVPMQNVTPQLSATPGRVRWAGGDHGADQSAVLADWLGVDQATPASAAAAETD
ncbi:formyl-CoA transferase [Williamsia sp. 1138]|uniref:CaiB/BaiF CoA transferase family protein n=1 Tax=Williamsia sp. 1138 TaxID=1903117 RepID=UPI000A0F9A33|nr:CoA transferase [Williamsia sp. 1138]OZG26147.1 formyl-CoA transferase [Williamsia sp. 1138]